jgi:uncharacterized protein
MSRLHIALPAMALLITACTEPAKPTGALPLTGRVVDAANLLSPAQEQALTARLAALEADGKGPQFVVATTPTLKGQEIDFYSIDLARAWQIGTKSRGDGVLLLVAPNERKVRIEVGTGLEKRLPDEVCAEIIKTDLLPAFRSGDMAGGIERGVDAIIAQLNARSMPMKKVA